MNLTATLPLVSIDTETTGLDSGADEILQVSIVDESGETLYNCYFKPRNHTEWADAEKVNHITPEMVRDCQNVSESAAAISRILASAGKIVGYNTPFDLNFLRAAGVIIPERAEIVDVMQMFSEIKGDWDDVHGGLKWHKLTECAEYCRYNWGGAAHDSLQDARATMFCYKHLNAAMRLAAGSGEDIAPASDIVTGAATHELKIRSKFFEAVVSGKKTFEIRKNDRNFKVGDIIALNEHNSVSGYTGESALFEITYVMTDTEYVKEGFAVLGIKRCYIHKESPLASFFKAVSERGANNAEQTDD